MVNKEMKMTNTDWKKQLTPLEYHVTREGGTESPYNNKYYLHTESGIYHCICCDSELFISNNKYDSGSGWPSYNQPVNDSALNEIEDLSLDMIRTEVKCAKCDAHLGHVFPDESQKTGKRY